MSERKYKWPIILHLKIQLLTERHAVTAAVFILGVGLLLMAREDPRLWSIELFKIILQGVILSGIIQMVMGFHFSANKGDETKSENTAKAFEAIRATAGAVTVPVDATAAAYQVADAAATEAAAIEEGPLK